MGCPQSRVWLPAHQPNRNGPPSGIWTYISGRARLMHVHFSQHAMLATFNNFTPMNMQTDMSCQGDTGWLTFSVCWF